MAGNKTSAPGFLSNFTFRLSPACQMGMWVRWYSEEVTRPSASRGSTLSHQHSVLKGPSCWHSLLNPRLQYPPHWNRQTCFSLAGAKCSSHLKFGIINRKRLNIIVHWHLLHIQVHAWLYMVDLILGSSPTPSSQHTESTQLWTHFTAPSSYTKADLKLSTKTSTHHSVFFLVHSLFQPTILAYGNCLKLWDLRKTGSMRVRITVCSILTSAARCLIEASSH